MQDLSINSNSPKIKENENAPMFIQSPLNFNIISRMLSHFLNQKPTNLGGDYLEDHAI